MSSSSSARRAIVVGSRGQDGSYLVEHLTGSGVAVVGLSRDAVFSPGGSSPPLDLTDRKAVDDLVSRVRPDEIYYLAARHGSSEQGVTPDEPRLLEESFAVHVLGLVHFLDAVRMQAPSARLLYAASAHVFGGDPATTPQNESTPFRPDSPYAITKAAGLAYCRYYRRRYGVFCSGAILFNHESPRRQPQFVSQRVVHGVADILAGRTSTLTIGSLDSVVDWGWAPDFVDAMTRILRHDVADDFVVATGEPHTVADLAAIAFRLAGIANWRSYVRESPDRVSFARKPLIGDSTRLRLATGWAPKVSFEEIVTALWAAATRTAEAGHAGKAKSR